MRLVDADELIKSAPTNLGIPIWQIDNAPTIDAVEVVRCKDCRWGKEACGNIECSADLNLPPEYHGYEWFCPNGEREENGVL